MSRDRVSAVVDQVTRTARGSRNLEDLAPEERGALDHLAAMHDLTPAECWQRLVQAHATLDDRLSEVPPAALLTARSGDR